MSRLEEECIMYIGRNRSGIDSGCIDYGIFTDRFDRMCIKDLKDCLRSIDVIEQRVRERIAELNKTSEER